jgi:arginine decarboxylase
MVFATHSTHKLLAGISQASQILVQESKKDKLDRHLFNEAYMMHTSTSAAVRDHRFVRRGRGDDGAARRHGAGEESIRGAQLPPRDAQGRCANGARTGGSKVWGPERDRESGIGNARDWMLRSRMTIGTASAIWSPASTCSTRSRRR